MFRDPDVIHGGIISSHSSGCLSENVRTTAAAHSKYRLSEALQ